MDLLLAFLICLCGALPLWFYFAIRDGEVTVLSLVDLLILIVVAPFSLLLFLYYMLLDHGDYVLFKFNKRGVKKK